MISKKGHIVWAAVVACALVLTGLVHWLPVRVDLTDDHRYSLHSASIAMLQHLDQPVEVSVCLPSKGLNPGFSRLRQSTLDMLDEMDVHADLQIRTWDGEDQEMVDGLQPTVIHEREQNGRTAQTLVYPFVRLRYGDREAVVRLLQNQRGRSGEENLNASIENIEFALMEALYTLQRTDVPRIALLEGHGELDEAHTFDLSLSLSRYYQVDRGVLGNNIHDLDGYRCVIVADPQRPFSDKDKYLLDQYIMRGGSVLWVLNGVQLSTEVLSDNGFTPALPLDLGLNDMLYRYGVRINPMLVQDAQCLPIPVDVSSVPGEENLQSMPWFYAPLLLTNQQNPISKDVNQVMSMFCSPIDAVGGEDGIRKEVLLATSTASRVIGTPAEIDLMDLNPDPETFRYQYMPVAVALEGQFPSQFAHRMMPDSIVTDEPTRTQSTPTRQIVIGSGSIIRNEVQQGQPLPLGYDRYTRMQFGNGELLTNCVLWLTEGETLIGLRERSVTLRLLNDRRAHDHRTTIQLISTLLPLAMLTILALVVLLIRKYKYIR